MKRCFLFISISFIVLYLFGCTSKQLKSDLTPDYILSGYDESEFSTWLHNINKEDLSIYKYHTEIKVFNPLDESRDYIFIYFFDNNLDVKKYLDENNSKSGLTWFLSFFLIMKRK